MNIKCLILITAGLIILAFALVFGEFNFSRGVFFYAPFLYMGAFACMGFGALVWWLDVPKPNPKTAKDFITLFYEPAQNGAQSAIVFEDTDGWFKFMTDIDEEDADGYAAVYDRSERKCLEASIRQYLEDEARPGFLKRKYIPKELEDISYNIDGDGEILFVLMRKAEFAAPALVDYGEEELVDEGDFE